MFDEQHIRVLVEPTQHTIPKVSTSTARLGQALQTARRERNLTQNDLSKLCGLGQPLLSRIETGHANPSLSTVSRILRDLTCSFTLKIDDDTNSGEDTSTKQPASYHQWNTIRGLVTKGQLGNALRISRKKHNLRQADLAEICKMSRAHISCIEAGRGNVRVGTILRILNGVNCSLDLVLEDMDGFNLNEYISSLSAMSPKQEAIRDDTT